MIATKLQTRMVSHQGGGGVARLHFKKSKNEGVARKGVVKHDT